MKYYLFLFTNVLFLFNSACSPRHEGTGENTIFASTNKELESAALKVIETKCSSCHGLNAFSGGVGNLTSIEYLLKSNLIVPGNSTQGRLIQTIEEGSMPTNGTTVTDLELNIIKNWIDNGFTVIGGTVPPNIINPTIPNPNITGSPLQVDALTIIQKQCSGCHGSPSNGAGNVSDILNVKHLLESGLVVPGNTKQGRFMGSIYDGTMPKSQFLTPSEITTLEKWITTDIDPNAQVILPPTEVVKPTYSSIAKLILEPKCVICHGPSHAADGIRVDTYAYLLGTMGGKRTVTIGNAIESKLYKSVKSKEMPPQSDGYVALDLTESNAIRDWINAGALNN